MREFPQCPRCSVVFIGASTPQGGRARNKPFPERSTGYCATCHIGLTKINGVWAATVAMSERACVQVPSKDRDRMLRPLERRVLRLVDEGVGDVEIARRFRRSPRMIRRIIVMTRLPRDNGAHPLQGKRLRPLERRVLRWRERGAAYAEIGPRFRRSPAFVERVEVLARYKLEQLGRGTS